MYIISVAQDEFQRCAHTFTLEDTDGVLCLIVTASYVFIGVAAVLVSVIRNFTVSSL